MIYDEKTFPPNNFNTLSYDNDDYRILAVEKWYENEISRCYRKLEIQVEVRRFFFYNYDFMLLISFNF